MRLQLPGTRAGDAVETRTTGQVEAVKVPVVEAAAAAATGGEDAMEVDGAEEKPKMKKERSEEEKKARKAKKESRKTKKESD